MTTRDYYETRLRTISVVNMTSCAMSREQHKCRYLWLVKAANYVLEMMAVNTKESPFLQVTQDLITNNYLDRECYLLLFEILNEYRSIISDSERLLNFDDDISVHLNVLLCVISNCLGHHFNSFKESIASKVEVFKTENINQIDNLPSAEDLVTLLFPQCMQVFMITWMSTHNRTLTCNSDFGPSPKKRKMQDAHQVKEVTDKNFDKCESQPTNVFPFIQLILEFANNVLISGVAHVLYSRLLHST